MDEFDLDDDVFDGLDESDLQELERPAKRQKSSHIDPATPAAPVAHDPRYLTLAKKLLAEKFGYADFRHEQAGAIQSLLAGNNTLAIFPTGAGKSLCYQIPAIAFPELDRTEGRAPENAGLTIVVSPLIALMKDQVDALQKRGISADSIDSTKTWEQQREIYAKIRRSELRILYCAPERLNNEGFVISIRDVPGGIRLLAVDEAHCVSEWGHSFRPDYLKVARFVDEVKAERVVCLTATATPQVAQDICKAFKIEEACVYKTSPYRPNLELHARSIEGDDGSANEILDAMLGFTGKTEADKRFGELFAFLRANPGPTLIYVGLQNQAEIHASVLSEQGFSAAAFHGGMKTEDKARIQEDFMASRIQIICATIAFGMGIDKPDIRNIVHWDLSNTVEEYSQQIGRAGRDGKPSRCMFYLAPSAFYLREVFARGDLPSRPSLKALFQDILNQARGRAVGDVFKVSHWHQGKEFDIRDSPLSVIYATLELRFGLFRATTPEYSSYKFEASKSYFPVIKNDETPAGKAVFSHAKKKVKFHDMDVNAACKATGLNRNDIIGKLNKLNELGHIKLMTKGIEHRYVIKKKLPETESEINAILDKLYVDMVGRENDAVSRGREVMDLITGRKCFALQLAEHFGMGLPDGKLKCGHCTYCITGIPVKPPRRPLTHTTTASIRGVLKATTVRDDPRLLARVAFGIRSPRISQLKLDKSNVFRSLAHHDFEALLREFTKVCN
ncbi:P-loop containing nucleoside triphosphate hydrolase protein [Cercophora newfieldiana]|uniref:DNA 3'-5' helicase n=1 Tax=Cercophora newfieldiana TaxID=92897 RepID=A0AA40CJL2_9PEZI|nr:P-loop containing nucleoside triphosphate hydrolase protein [Cercophora newfieldiana]